VGQCRFGGTRPALGIRHPKYVIPPRSYKIHVMDFSKLLRVKWLEEENRRLLKIVVDDRLKAEIIYEELKSFKTIPGPLNG
jgi:hypothetical protein